METPRQIELNQAQRDAVENTKAYIESIKNASQKLPKSRELSLAITKLDEAEMWLVRAIAFHGVE